MATINYRSQFLAIAIVAGSAKILHTTTDSKLFSYGVPRWVDDSGDDYGQVNLPDISIDIIAIVEIDDDLYYSLYAADGGIDD